MAAEFKGDVAAFNELVAKLPTAKTKAEFEARQALFDTFDPNGNGFLSLAEVDRGLAVLGFHELFDAKPVIMRGFQAAKAVHSTHGRQSKNDDYVERIEFRLL
eukprot:CAMPEP_0205826822 /NCGR_PEP_ID=MMETSP0206-20130828/29978_1 /ASSEMBLY_ACC=CAM_ASM_000279 /TAXON_ID=36767 /ORGANISM="Euplotes focardii, Strain TN1" /LENGTH=102 /DNA_ID=CAMNT_0053127099 /DNA_START=62 /DNA_END=366 /DNA_ORIENTATION=+